MGTFGAAPAKPGHIRVSGLAGAIHRTIPPLVARACGLAGLLPCRRRRAATRQDGIHSLPSGSLADRSPNVTDPRRGNARRSAVISSPHLGVFAVAAAGVLCAFPARWTHYLNSVSAAGPVPTPLSLPFLELNSYRVNAV